MRAGGGGVSNRTKNRTKNRGMPRLCHDMCVLMTDVPSRGVSAVLTDVQSWPRATRVCRRAAAAGTGATGVDGQSVTRLSQGRAGRSRPAGRHRTVLFISSVHDRRPAPGCIRAYPCRRPAVTRSDANVGRSPPIWSHRHIRPRPASGPCGRARVATMTIGDAYVDDRGHL